MKKLVSSILFLHVLLQVQSQTTPTPDKLWGKLFEEVQAKRILGDNKTFVDAVPKVAPQTVLQAYHRERSKDTANFDLKAFVEKYFTIPAVPDVRVKQGLSLKAHLEDLWNVLTRKADKRQPWSSLLPLPKPYIVPGGRFREIYYWDSYFTMQGLAVSGRFDLIGNMLDNFKSLIDQYDHIPNGNRNYYLSRSQPPYFALMVDLLQEEKGPAIYQKYYSAMEKEYRFWMDGMEKLKTTTAYRRLVKMPDGSVLNRYWDDNKAPRQEAYSEDVATARKHVKQDGMAYTHLRASAESGWDFSSRWFEDTLHLNTIETSDIVPVDLNGLLYAYERILAKASAQAKNKAKQEYYNRQAEKRRAAVNRYCWDRVVNYYFDYDFREKATTGIWSLAATMPLLVQMASKEQAEGVRLHLEAKFLKEGGFVTTLYETGEQWDAPNGWAPLQYVAVQGLLNYEFHDLAKKGAERWMALNERVFNSTGKMLEKYNVVNIHLETGGGEYPNQDGFGWTNGIYLKFDQLFRGQKL